MIFSNIFSIKRHFLILCEYLFLSVNHRKTNMPGNKEGGGVLQKPKVLEILPSVPILDTNISFVLPSDSVRHAQGTPLDYETGWTRKLWYKTFFLFSSLYFLEFLDTVS